MMTPQLKATITLIPQITTGIYEVMDCYPGIAEACTKIRLNLQNLETKHRLNLYLETGLPEDRVPALAAAVKAYKYVQGATPADEIDNTDDGWLVQPQKGKYVFQRAHLRYNKETENREIVV